MEICDCMIPQIIIRFSFIGHLLTTNLFTQEHFTKYCDKFPDKLLCEVVNVYSFLEVD